MHQGGDFRLTKKEIQLFQFLYDFFRKTKGGEIKIVFHNHEPQSVSLAQFNIVLTGKEKNNLDFEKHLTDILKFAILDQ